MAQTQLRRDAPAMPASTDRQLSFRKAYADHIGIVQYMLKPFRFSAQDEEDLTQEIFLRYFHSMKKVEDTKVRAYLITVTKNAAIDLYRRRKARGEEFMLELNAETAKSVTDHDLSSKRQRIAVSQFLDSLHKDPQAEILVLFYDQELGVKEIAERSKESIGTITSRLTRCRQKYKRALEAHLAQSEMMSSTS